MWRRMLSLELIKQTYSSSFFTLTLIGLPCTSFRLTNAGLVSASIALATFLAACFSMLCSSSCTSSLVMSMNDKTVTSRKTSQLVLTVSIACSTYNKLSVVALELSSSTLLETNGLSSEAS